MKKNHPITIFIKEKKTDRMIGNQLSFIYKYSIHILYIYFNLSFFYLYIKNNMYMTDYIFIYTVVELVGEYVGGRSTPSFLKNSLEYSSNYSRN